MSVKPQWGGLIEERLVQLVKEGLSCSLIADQLNTEFLTHLTRSAVGGQIFRMRVASGDDEFRAGKSVGRKPGLRNGGSVAAALQKKYTRTRKPPKFNPEPFVRSDGSVNSPKRRHFTKIEGEHCKWPLWEDGVPFKMKMSCNNPTIGGCVYCTGHRAIAYGFRSVRKPGAPDNRSRWFQRAA